MGMKSEINSRIDITDLATVLKYYGSQGRTFKTRSEMLRAAVEDFVSALVSADLVKRVESPSEAAAMMDSLGIKLTSGDRGIKSLAQELAKGNRLIPSNLDALLESAGEEFEDGNGTGEG